MKLDEIFGHERIVERLRRALESERLPHALLFHGPDGVGKGTLARALAGALLCERGGADACGTCHACEKPTSRLRRSLHPASRRNGTGSR